MTHDIADILPGDNSHIVTLLRSGQQYAADQSPPGHGARRLKQMYLRYAHDPFHHIGAENAEFRVFAENQVASVRSKWIS